MRHLPALGWLGLVLIALAYLIARVSGGPLLETNLLALLPQAEQDLAVQQAKDRVANNFGRRIVIMIGHADGAKARAAAADLAKRLNGSGMVASLTFALDAQTQRRVGAAYFPYRSVLLSTGDREKLETGRGKEIVDRALSVVFGPGGAADARLLRNDPFLLLGSFLTDLPLPESRLVNEEGVLMAKDGARSYAFLSAQLKEDAFSLAFQERFVGFVEGALKEIAGPDFTVLKTGAVFYARDGAQRANRETSIIGIVSLAGTVLMIFLVFGALRPIWLSVLAILVGILCALAFCFWFFQQLHVVALLLGVSLIGISVDYSLQYCCEYFDPGADTARERLRRVLPGVLLGLGTTLVGYLTLLLAPFPGLRQVALFSVVGLIASFLTVALWYPILDRGTRPARTSRLLGAASWFWRFSEEPRFRSARLILAGVLCLIGVAGAFVIRADDDIRHLQGAPADLRSQEQEIQRLTGFSGGSQFLLVRAADTEAALRMEEALAPRLEAAKREGLLRNFQSAAQFVPSIARQRENRALVRDRLLAPFLKDYLESIGLSDQPATGQEGDPAFLTLAMLPQDGPFALVSGLVTDEAGSGAVHVMLLNGATDIGRLRQTVEGMGGVSLVDPVADISALFGEYRTKAVLLLALSAILMLPILMWRYGMGGGLKVIAPSVAAVLLTAPIVALLGGAFTFFNAMALVLVLSIGIDYSVFCREAGGARKRVTLLAVALAALSTILSFGLLALSGLFVVHTFGLTVLIGIGLAFLFAPAAAPKRLAN